MKYSIILLTLLMGFTAKGQDTSVSKIHKWKLGSVTKVRPDWTDTIQLVKQNPVYISAWIVCPSVGRKYNDSGLYVGLIVYDSLKAINELYAKTDSLSKDVEMWQKKYFDLGKTCIEMLDELRPGNLNKPVKKRK